MGSNKWLQVHDLPGGKAELRILSGPAQDSIARVGNTSLSLVTICGRAQVCPHKHQTEEETNMKKKKGITCTVFTIPPTILQVQ